MRRRDAAGLNEHTVSQTDSTREHLIETYRKKAKHYDITSRLYPAPGYPQRTQRLRAVQALGLRKGDTVMDMASGKARGRRFARPCRKNCPISPGPSCSSEPHSSLPGPAALGRRGEISKKCGGCALRPEATGKY